MMEKKRRIIFGIHSYLYLRDALLENGHFEVGEVERKTFPDGERYQRILTPVDGSEVIVVGGTINDADTLELYDLSYTLVKSGAISLTIVIPYFGYSTMERAVKSGEVVTAKSRASLFSSIPQTSKRNRFVFLDLHSEGIPHYFEGQSVTIHLYGKEIVLKAAKELAGDHFVFACTDSGRAKWVESLANDIGVDAAFVFKRRLTDEKTVITSISADVENKSVVIYDDMIRTGGSLINAAKAYKEAGANSIFVITTHGLFSKDAFDKIKNSGVIEKLICTNSHPNALEIRDEFLSVKNIAHLIRSKIGE